MSELSDSRRRALDALVDARDKLEAGGFQTDLSETVGLGNGGLVIKLVVKGLKIADANYLVNKIFGFWENAT